MPRKRSTTGGPPLDLPPFPALTWAEYHWVGQDILPSWAEVDVCYDDMSRRKRKPASGGKVRIVVERPSDQRSPPSRAQALAYQHIKDNEASLVPRALASIFPMYEDERAQFIRDQGDDLAYMVPRATVPLDLRTVLRLVNVHVNSVAKDGLAYVGLAFNCTWEIEHGVGLMLHGDRVLKVGHADCAFNQRIGRTDGGTDVD